MSYRQKSGHYYGLYGPQFKAQYDLETGPREIGFKFFRNSRHKFDYLNPAQTVQDEMVKYGWLEDDNMLCIIPVFFEYEYDKLNPGVEINLMEK